MTRSEPTAAVAAVEREIAREIVKWVRAGAPLRPDLTALQRQEARRLLVDVGTFWQLVRDKRGYRDHGFATFEEGVRARYGVSLADAEAVIRAAEVERRRTGCR
ncbi:MAG: hypothetical protein M3065_21815 [Actinomycetota bacterium]|nr:hypothetical protein [Actinomycetota bacterium]